MLYTSYFGKLKQIQKFPGTVYPISIAAVTPKWFQGRSFTQLAPSFELLHDWKTGHADEAAYRARYMEQLNRLDVHEILRELPYLLPTIIWDIHENPEYHVALLCYEKPDAFCHRHLVAEWFTNNGISCEEMKL